MLRLSIFVFSLRTTELEEDRFYASKELTLVITRSWGECSSADRENSRKTNSHLTGVGGGVGGA